MKELNSDETQLLQIEDNNKLAKLGSSLCSTYIRAILNFWYPKLPQEGVE